MRNKWKKRISLILLLSAGLLGLRDICALGTAAAGMLQLSADAEQTRGMEEETESGDSQGKDQLESGDAEGKEEAESGDAKKEESGDAEEKPEKEEEEKKEEETEETEEEKEEKKEEEVKPDEKEAEKEEKKTDQEAPELEIQFDGQAAENGSYYRQQRTARISLKDEQISLEDVHILVSGREVKELFWQEEGEGWQTSLTFSEDGNYLIEVYAEDKAGNKSYLSSESFVIDSLSPTISISGIEDESANRGRVSPVIEIRDQYLDEKESRVTLTGANHGVLSLNQTLSEEEGLIRIALSDIPQEKDYDDLYTLQVCGRDLAGNQTEKAISFSVNRYGSVYTIEGNPQEWMNRYNQEVPEIIVHEYNIDRLNEGERELVLTENGLVSEAEEGRDYQLSFSESKDGWKEYSYSIAKESFHMDGSYRLAFYSRDRAGNINQSTKQLEISFGLDREKPKISPINLEEGGCYETEEESYKGAFSVSDNIGLENVTLLLDGRVTETKEEKGIWSFTIPAGEKAHKIQVIALDLAGNRTDYCLEELRVQKEEQKEGLRAFLGQLFGREGQEREKETESGDVRSKKEKVREGAGILGVGSGIGLLLIFLWILKKKVRQSA